MIELVRRYMMPRKKKASEGALRTMMKYYKFFVHKWRDRGYIHCPQCHRQITKCPICHGDMLLQKAQTYPDFLVADRYAFVECKQTQLNFNMYDLSERQEHILTEAPTSGWVYFELGDGPGPKREAYLVEWRAYVGLRQHIMDKLGFKSVVLHRTKRGRAPEAREFFLPWRLEWKPIVGWIIPEHHEWWVWFPEFDRYVYVPDKEPEEAIDG
jgi:hypothetical protein